MLYIRIKDKNGVVLSDFLDHVLNFRVYKNASPERQEEMRNEHALCAMWRKARWIATQQFEKEGYYDKRKDIQPSIEEQAIHKAMLNKRIDEIMNTLTYEFVEKEYTPSKIQHS